MISVNRLDRGFFQYQQEYEAKALAVLRSGWYVLGNEVHFFEEEFAKYIGANYCVGVASGLDALWIAVKALGIGEGDEIIVQGNTYIASVMGITINGATPVFVEPDAFYQIDASRIEEKITPRTKAVMVVHLYGHIAQMDEIMRICSKHHLKLIEDCAQAHGAAFHGEKAGTFGDISCFSFYPSKNLGAFGDAGAVVTNHAEYADFVRVFRNYGSEKRYYNQMVGANSRLDELQAGLLRVKLGHIQEILEEREKLAERYQAGIQNELMIKPSVRPDTVPAWHQYIIRAREREKLIAYLEQKKIASLIHYPIPPHMSEAYQYLEISRGALPITEEYADCVLSIPFYNGMTEEEQGQVIDALNAYRG